MGVVRNEAKFGAHDIPLVLVDYRQPADACMFERAPFQRSPHVTQLGFCQQVSLHTRFLAADGARVLRTHSSASVSHKSWIELIGNGLNSQHADCGIRVRFRNLLEPRDVPGGCHSRSWGPTSAMPAVVAAVASQHGRGLFIVSPPALEAAGQKAVYRQVAGAGHAFFDWKPDAPTMDSAPTIAFTMASSVARTVAVNTVVSA